MTSKVKYLIPLLFLSVLGWSVRASAHGINVEHRKTQAIEIEGVYDNGEPMVNAQVVVYAPDDPSTPWKKGTTDKEGHFTFSPDPSQPGNWEVKVRQAGHGEIIRIPVSEETVASGESSNRVSQVQELRGSDEYTPLQKVFLGAAGVWGFIGTALFFARRKTD